MDNELNQNRLYRKTDDRLKWDVPSVVRWRVLKLTHDNHGHFGVEKNMNNITSYYWFSGMRNNVNSYIAACIEYWIIPEKYLW